LAIRGAGIACIVAESFARIFFRNCIDRGLYAVELPDATRHIRQGDRLRVDISAGVVDNLTTGSRHPFIPYPDFIGSICDQGGLFPYGQHRLNAIAKS
jgi:3-isopropylmalate/(R)-2-methylmalate dehydratase small subunit